MRPSMRTVVFLMLGGIVVWFLTDTLTLRAAAAEGLSLCARTVVPALFPFLVLCDLLISLGFAQWLSARFAGLMGPLFHLPGLASSALLLGLVGGYPIGAKTAAALYRNRLLTLAEAQRLLTFCNNANPAFFVGVLGGGVFGSPRVGVWLWLIHLLAALLTGLLLRNQHVGSGKPDNTPLPSPPSFFPTFIHAVQNAVSSILAICGFVTWFYMLTRPLATIGGRLSPFLIGFVELFSLTPHLEPDRLGFVAAATLSGWGGLSVLCQTAAVLDGTGLHLRWYVLGKAAQALLSALLSLLLVSWVLP